MDRNFKDPGEALCFMVECTMATFEGEKLLSRSSKAHLSRLEGIVEVGLRNCEVFKLEAVAEALRARKDQPPSKDARVYYSTAEALCHMIECTVSLKSYIAGVKRFFKREVDRHQKIADTGLDACRKFGLVDAAHSSRSITVEKILRAALEEGPLAPLS
jgi:hypothetical protein